MQELIKITKSKINDEEINSVNARELHAFLESKQRFTDWIKDRIEKWGFINNKDFMIIETAMNAVHKNMKCDESEIKGPVKKEFIITLDMAKELAMIENNEKGKQARKYFIECEKKLKEIKNELSLDNNALAYAEELLKVTQKFIDSEKERIELKKTVDTITSAKNNYTMNQVAKHLEDCGRNKLFIFLRENSILMNNNLPFQVYKDKGYFDVITNTFGETNIPQTLVTPKGLEFITKLWSNK